MDNGMTKEDEIMLILQEECAEVIQAISKVKRFGKENNMEGLKLELADLQCMIDLMKDFKVVEYKPGEFYERIESKINKLKIYSSIYQ